MYPTELIEDIGFGESMQGGGNVGRYAANQLGMVNLPGVATQRWCASGMAGTQWIAASIAAGMIDAGIGGGVESMSTAPATAKAGEPLVAGSEPRDRGRAAVQHREGCRRQRRPHGRRHP